MESEIIKYKDDPAQLESLYRKGKKAFAKGFHEIYPQIQGNPVAEFWKARLDYKSEQEGIYWGTKKEFRFVLILALLAGLFAKTQEIFAIDEDFFYPRNLAFIAFPAVTSYFASKNHLKSSLVWGIVSFTLGSLIYINLLPDDQSSDTLILACIHLPLLLWAVLGFSYSGNDYRALDNRMDFLRFNGDVIIMGVVLGISFALMSGLTMGLFELIGINISEFYTKYIFVFGLASIPPLATHLTQTNPHLVSKVSPIVAKIFSPLILVMLIIYLGAIVYSGKDPYNDREFLLLFNMLLIGVLALIFFSVAESSKDSNAKAGNWVLGGLAIVTIIVNLVALSAIAFRITEYGITPNRMAVLGINIIMLIHLFLVCEKLIKLIRKQTRINEVGQTIARFLPVYFIWTAIVVFLFPLIFNFQ